MTIQNYYKLIIQNIEKTMIQKQEPAESVKLAKNDNTELANMII